MSRSNHTICEFTADTLVELQLACLPGDEPLQQPSRCRYWVARRGGDIEAFVIMYLFADCWYLARAGTLPEAQGQHLYPRLIRAAFTAMRKISVKLCVTDCAYWNTRSANGLIRAGFRLYEPSRKWGFSDGLYWQKAL